MSTDSSPDPANLPFGHGRSGMESAPSLSSEIRNSRSDEFPAKAGTAEPPALSVVVPACNEESRLPETLHELRRFLDMLNVDYQVVVVDDGSQDETAAVSDRFGDRFSTVSLECNQGKGAAVRTGMLHADGQVVAFMDADLPYQLDSLREGYEAILSGQTEVILGARDMDGSGCLVRRRTSRSLASVAFRILTRWLISREITDTQAGFKCFERATARRIFSQTTIDSFAFDTEVVALIHALQIRYQRVPVTLINERASTLSLFRHALPMFVDMFRVRWNFWRGMYSDTLPFPEANGEDDDQAIDQATVAATDSSKDAA